MDYIFNQKKWGVSVYRYGLICCAIDEDFAIEAGYKSAMEYCKAVFN